MNTPDFVPGVTTHSLSNTLLAPSTPNLQSIPNLTAPYYGPGIDNNSLVVRPPVATTFDQSQTYPTLLSRREQGLVQLNYLNPTPQAQSMDEGRAGPAHRHSIVASLYFGTMSSNYIPKYTTTAFDGFPVLLNDIKSLEETSHFLTKYFGSTQNFYGLQSGTTDVFGYSLWLWHIGQGTYLQFQLTSDHAE